MPPVNESIIEKRPNVDVDDLNGREHEWIIASIGHKTLSACWYYDAATLQFIIRDDRYDVEGYPKYFRTIEAAAEVFNLFTNKD